MFIYVCIYIYIQIKIYIYIERYILIIIMIIIRCMEGPYGQTPNEETRNSQFESNGFFNAECGFP